MTKEEGGRMKRILKRNVGRSGRIFGLKISPTGGVEIMGVTKLKSSK